MSLMKGNLSSNGLFTATDSIRGLRLIAPGTYPSYFGLECGDGVDWYFWVNNSDNLVMDNDPPASDHATAGTIVTGSGYGGANKTLSNLGTVAIATDFLPNGTIDLGNTSNYFAEGYITKWLGHANSTITATDGVFTVVGSFVFGASGGAAGNADLVWHAHTDTNFVTFDEDQECVTFEDETFLKFGTGRDMSFDWDGTDFNVDAAASNKIFMFGEARDLDVVLKSQSSDTNDVAWDASGKTLQLAGAAVLAFGGSAPLTHSDGFTITFDESDTLNIDTLTGNAGDVVRFGETYTCDVYFDGLAGYDMRWKADVDELQLYDNAQFRLGTSATLHLDMWADGTDMHIEAGVANGKVQWGMTNATDLYLHGATANRDCFWDASEDELVLADNAILVFGGNATTGADDLIMTSNGTVVNATLGSTTASLNLITGTGTVHGFAVDGTTGSWVGANNVGLVEINTDGVIKAGANLLRIDSSGANTAASFAVEIIVSGTVAGSTLGTALNITDTGAVAGTSYAAYINSTANAALNLVTGAVDKEALVMTGVQGQTASILHADGDTGTGWIGADVTGLVHINTKVAHDHVGATNLYVGNATGAVKASAAGSLARFINTGAAQAGAIMVEIAAKDSTEYALDISKGLVEVAEHVHAKGYEYNVVTRTANDAGDGTAIIAAGEQFLQVDTTTADDADIITLPAGLAGMIIYIYNSDGTYDFVIDANASETINGGANITLGQDDLAILRCVADGVWVASEIAANGALSTAA